MRLAKTLPLLALVLLAVGCRTSRTPAQVDSLVRRALISMDDYTAQGDEVEAGLMARAVSFVDPDRPEIQPVLSNSEDIFYDRGLRGANASLRVDRPAGFLRRVLLYIPDRILDVLDLISFDIHVGPGLFVDVHGTRFLTAAAGLRATGGVGWHFDRSLGVQTQVQSSLWLVAGAGTYSGARLGTSGVASGSYANAVFQSPFDPLYQTYNDYWAVGFGATIVIVGVDFDIHLFQALDLVAGIFTFDPSNDDLATSQGLDLTGEDQRLILDLSEVAESDSELEDYRAWLAEREADVAAPTAQTSESAPAGDPTPPPVDAEGTVDQDDP